MAFPEKYFGQWLANVMEITQEQPQNHAQKPQLAFKFALEILSNDC